MTKIIIFMALWFTMHSAHAGLLYTYNQLKLKDLDQMSKIVKDKVKEAAKDGGNQVVPLKEGLQAVFSRPDDDGMIEKVVGPLKSALEDRDAWEATIKQLVKEATSALKNSKAFTPVVQVTYLVFLENILGELKPRGEQDFEKSVITQIRDAKIEISKEAKKERILRMMKESPSPSVAATDYLQFLADQEKERSEAAKKTSSKGK